MIEPVFIITIVAESLLGAGLIITLLKPGFRLWPPPGKNSWQFWYVWATTIIATVGLFWLSFLDWDSWFFHHWARYIPAAILIAGGTFSALWGVSSLSLHNSLGLKGRLITSGAYRYTRNPQYVGDIAITLGILIAANSFLVFIAGALAVILFVLTPFTEEPWLQERFKTDYNQYKARVPRFI